MIRILVFFIGLSLTLLQFPFGPPPPEEPKEKPSPVKGWWELRYFGVPPNHYSEAGKGVIKVESLGSRSSLFKEVRDKEKGFPILSWRWKISNVVRSAIETRKDRFDAAARVMVVFGKTPSFSPFGREPIGLKIEYIWATHLPKGDLFDHPGERNCKVFVLESGEAKVGQWIDEVRNLHHDFKKAFGKDPEGVLAIGIQTDTDHSNEMVTAYYTEPRLKKR